MINVMPYALALRVNELQKINPKAEFKLPRFELEQVKQIEKLPDNQGIKTIVNRELNVQASLVKLKLTQNDLAKDVKVESERLKYPKKIQEYVSNNSNTPLLALRKKAMMDLLENPMQLVSSNQNLLASNFYASVKLDASAIKKQGDFNDLYTPIQKIQKINSYIENNFYRSPRLVA